jgi:hypothetical protein
MTLTYCMQLPVQTQTSLIAEPWELEAGPEAIAAVARKADQRGFLAVGVCDHVAIPRAAADRMRTTWYDTVSTLAWLAAQTTRPVAVARVRRRLPESPPDCESVRDHRRTVPWAGHPRRAAAARDAIACADASSSSLRQLGPMRTT